MDRITRDHFEHLASADGGMRYDSLLHILDATEQTVDWAYAVWDELVARLSHKDNHQRAIAAQVLSNLARSDPECRILDDFEALLRVTNDEKFVTARHSLQSIWKVGVAGEKHRILVLDALASRFENCLNEQNGSLVRYDIIQGMRKLYDEVQDDKVRHLALSLIESETDAKYHKKYARLWKNA